MSVEPQPTDSSCGPTCLHAVYRYWGDELELAQVIEQTTQLSTGGTLAVMLGCHALRRGYRATLYTYNLELLDPTWFALERSALLERLATQASVKARPRILEATPAFREFVSLGGELRLEDLSRSLLLRYLSRKVPLLAGLSATFLYRSVRERGPDALDDDVLGEPLGHFVLLAGHRSDAAGLPREILVADPWQKNPLARSRRYWAPASRLLNAILLGVFTYDGNLLAIEPTGARRGSLEEA